MRAMSVDSTAATRASESDSDLSSYSNWSVLEDSDNNNHHARKIRMGGKKPLTQSKTKIKPPKANKKFDIEEEIFMMEDVLSKSSSEDSVHVQYDNLDYKEELKDYDSSEAFEDISIDPVRVIKTSSVELFRRKMKENLSGNRTRLMSLLQLIGLLFIMTSFSYIPALFGRHFVAEPGALIPNKIAFDKITEELNTSINNNSFNGIPIMSDKDLSSKLPDIPTVVILPPEGIEDENITKLASQEIVKPHFHNDGRVSYGPMTYKDYLNKQKNKLVEMKTAKESANNLKKDSESLSNTVARILKQDKSPRHNIFKCCNAKNKLFKPKQLEISDKPAKDMIKPITEDVMNKKATILKKNQQFKPTAEEPSKWDFNSTRIDDIINNFTRYIKKNALSAPKEKRSEKLLPRPTKDDLALHKIAKNNDVFKRCATKHKNYFNFKKIEDCFFFRFAVCMVLDIVVIITIRKLGIACVGQMRKLMGMPIKPEASWATVKKETNEIKRVDMFKLLPFHRTKARAIKKAKKIEKIEKVVCPEGKLIDLKPKLEYPSDYYLFMLGLKMKALDQNLKSKEDASTLRFGAKRYSTEFKQSLIKQLSGIYKETVKNDKLREDLVFCIMKIYECKFEYAPTCAYATTNVLNRLDKFKTLLVDYYRYQDNPLVNTKYLRNANTKQKEDLGHVLELMLEDQKLGATRSNIECTFTTDNSTFKYDAPLQQCQSAFLQKPATTQSSSNMFKTSASSVQSLNDPGYYMRERFSLLAKFWKLKQAYFTKRIQICNILKDKLSESSIAEHEGANILDGIINNAITSSSTTLRSMKIAADQSSPIKASQGFQSRDAFRISEEVITEVVDNVHKVFDVHRKLEQQHSLPPTKSDKCLDGPPMCKRICRVNNELYRELFEKKAQAIQEKDLSRSKALLAKTSEMNTKICLSRPYQVRDPRYHKKL